MITFICAIQHESPEVSVISGATPDRLHLANRCIAEMRVHFAGLPVEYVLAVLEGEPWNECRCKNLAATYAKGNIYVLTNCDIIIPEIVIHGAMQAREEMGDNFIVHCPRLDEQPDGTWLENPQALGDCQIVSKSLFHQVGGFDEDFYGWGYLDYDFAGRCEAAAGHAPLVADVSVHHCWHPRMDDQDYRWQNTVNRWLAAKKGRTLA